MKVALVSPGYPPTPGGVENVVAQTARALVRAGVRVEVLTQDPRPGLRPVIEDEGVLVRRFRCNRADTYRTAPGLYRHLARNSSAYDVVHGHSYHGLTGVAAGLVLRAGRSPVPYVFTPHYHGTGHTRARTLLHRAFRSLGSRALEASDAIVCVSRSEAELLRSHFPHAAGRITVIPNGVDGVALRGVAGFDGEPLTVLCVGRLVGYKRVDRVIEAFASVTQACGRPAQLVVIGAGPDRTSLERAAERSTARARIRFLGRVGDEDLRRWMRTAAVLCSLSEHEAYGLAPAEAMCAGAWAVLSDIPAHAELAAAGPVRLVAADAGPADVADLLRTCLATPAPALARAAVPDWAEIARLLTAVYREVSRSPRPPGTNGPTGRRPRRDQTEPLVAPDHERTSPQPCPDRGRDPL